MKTYDLAWPSLTPLIDMHYVLTPFTEIGTTAFGRRLYASTSGGAFEGARMKGDILPGGTDWIMMGADGTCQLDIDLTLKTDDGALIHGRWNGILAAPPQILMQITDPAKRGDVDPASYYFRGMPTFETGAEKYTWLNNVFAVATIRFTADGLFYHVSVLD